MFLQTLQISKYESSNLLNSLVCTKIEFSTKDPKVNNYVTSSIKKTSKENVLTFVSDTSEIKLFCYFKSSFKITG